MGKPGRVLNLGNDHDIRDLKRELGDDFELVKAVNTFTQKADALIEKNKPERSRSDDREQTTTARVATKTAQNSAPVLPKAKSTPAPEVIEKPKKKKRSKVSKDKGKPKWANKRES